MILFLHQFNKNVIVYLITTICEVKEPFSFFLFPLAILSYQIHVTIADSSEPGSKDTRVHVSREFFIIWIDISPNSVHIIIVEARDIRDSIM